MLQEQGNIPEHDMFNTFNMGVGMTVIVSRDDGGQGLAALERGGRLCHGRDRLRGGDG